MAKKIMVGLGILLISILSIYLIFFFQISHFRKPSGDYSIGKTTFNLVDSKRIEENSSLKGPRELMLQIWYPSKSKEITKSPYDPDALLSVKSFIHSSSNIPLFLLKGLNRIHTFAQNDAPIAPNHRSYLVIILLHGSGTMIQHYSWIAEEFASNGYIVLGINHPYMAAATRFSHDKVVYSLVNEIRKKGKVELNKWKENQFDTAIMDVKFVLDSLAELNAEKSLPIYNSLDMQTIGICGHSSGGCLAMRMCLEDRRIKAGISLDGSIRGSEKMMPFSTPFLLITGQESHVHKGADGLESRSKLTQLCKKDGMHMYIIMLQGVGHGVFSDLPFILNATLFGKMLSLAINVDMNCSSQFAVNSTNITGSLITTFFDHFLLNKPSDYFGKTFCDKVISIK